MQEAKTPKAVYKVLYVCCGFFARVSDKVLKSNYFCAEKLVRVLSAQYRTSGIILDVWGRKSVTKKCSRAAKKGEVNFVVKSADCE